MYRSEACQTTRPKYVHITGRLRRAARQKARRRPLYGSEIHTAIRSADTCIEFLGVAFSSKEYAPDAAQFPARPAATIKLTHYQAGGGGKFKKRP
jgi:hypothetical protein